MAKKPYTLHFTENGVATQVGGPYAKEASAHAAQKRKEREKPSLHRRLHIRKNGVRIT